jgi:hypothetical protein
MWPAVPTLIIPAKAQHSLTEKLLVTRSACYT